MVTVWTIVSGEERKTIKQFVQKHFPECAVRPIYPATFKGLTPDADEQIRMAKAQQRQIPLAPKARLRQMKNPQMSPGASGHDLVDRVGLLLPDFVGQIDANDIILVLDDLDCTDQVVLDGKDGTERRQIEFQEKISAIIADVYLVIGFAAPEAEAWIVADWHHIMRSSTNFSRCYHQMQRYLEAVNGVPFDAPETFGTYDANKGSCDEKLSSLIVACSMLPYADDPAEHTKDTIEQDVWPFSRKVHSPMIPYSKAEHTPMFIRDMNIKTVREKCPMFNQFFAELSRTVDLATVERN